MRYPWWILCFPVVDAPVKSDKSAGDEQRHDGEDEDAKQDISDLIDSLCSLGHHHKIYFLWRPSLRDPKDELILELTITAQCKYIVTYNIKDFTGTDEFGIKALTPKEFLKEIGELS